MGDKIKLGIDYILCTVLIQHDTTFQVICQMSQKQSESRALGPRCTCSVTRLGRFQLLEVRIEDCVVPYIGEGSGTTKYPGNGLQRRP